MREIEIREALREAIHEEMRRDDTVFVIGEEVGKYNGPFKVTKGMLDEWGPKRILDTPISEEAFCGLAIGAALTGLRPIVDFMTFNFSFVAADQIISNACKMHYMSGGRFKVPIVFRGPNGAAAQVSCQHSHNVAALYSNFPGLHIVAPSNAYDAKGLLKTAIRCNDPVLFLEDELDYGLKGEVPEDEYLIPFGKAKVLREGSDITLIGCSRMVKLCLQAAAEMAKAGVSVEVIDLRTIKPLDMGTIATSVRKTHRCLVVEEGHIFAGIAAEIGFQIQELCFDFLDAPLVRVCQRETPLPYSKPLEAASLPNLERILDALKRSL